MKAEPKWGRNGILQLNWIFDEYFATPAVATSVFEPLGVRHRPVLDKKGNELKTVVQIVVDAEVDIVTDGLTPEKCGRCSRLKYAPAVRGYFPPLAESVTGDIARTRQYFGSGASASKRILVARRLASALQSAMVRGVSLRPLAHSSPRPLAQSD
jgi:hypothetical protein